MGPGPPDAPADVPSEEGYRLGRRTPRRFQAARGAWSRTAFTWRLLAALVATLVLVGAAQYAVGGRLLSQRLLDQTLASYVDDAGVVMDVDEQRGRRGVVELLTHVDWRAAVLSVGVVDPDGLVVVSGGQHRRGADSRATSTASVASSGYDVVTTDREQDLEDHDLDDAHIRSGRRLVGSDLDIVREALATGAPLVRFDDDHTEPVAVYAVPMLFNEAPHILAVEVELTSLTAQLASLRTTLLVGLSLTALLGVPVFQLVGGRRLSALVRRHERRAVRDALTDLSNHRAYQEQIRTEVDRARREGYPLTLALLDLDGFKLINDTMGHRRGDELLAEVGTVLSSGRPTDLPFRVGGDEFALLLPGTDAEGARAVTERLSAEVTGRIPEVGISVGMAQLGRDAEDVDALLACADAAMYRAKRRGRSLVVAFSDLDPAEADTTLTKGTALRALLDVGEMQVAFQPVLDLDDGGVLGYEALARLPDVTGFAGPAEAFDTAERLGLVPELDALCRRTVLARAHDLPPDASLFLNVAPAALDHALLDWDRFGADVRAAGLTPSRVVIELTERSRIAATVLEREVAAARAVGFRIAVDDVGAGWTGFECLRAARPDIIKIDRSVVANAATDRTARATLVSILVYAQVAGADVIGEGVEDAGMLALLRSPLLEGTSTARVRGVQGYLFGRPSAAPTAPCPTAVH